MYNYNHNCPFEAYITNLGKYNEGALVGEWVNFPTTHEEIQKVFERIGIGSEDEFGNVYEEWFITDYDCYVDGLSSVLGEYESLDELNYLAVSIEAMDKDNFERFEAAIDIGDYARSVKDLINLTENLDNYDIYPDIHSHDDLGRMYIEEYGAMEVPEHLKNYIDYEAYGRDIALDEISQFTDRGYIRDTGNSFIEYYDGDRENIPEEYRIMSAPELSEDERLDMTADLAFDLDEFFRQKDPQYAAAHPDVQASKELIADLLLEGKTVAIKDRLAEMAQTPEDELVSRIGSYEQSTGYEAHLDTDIPAIREKLEQAQEGETDTITLLVVEPLKEPYIKEIASGLSAMQAEVDGMIAAAYPFDDPVAVICNDESKINGMELNRALRDDKEQIYDIVAGTFLVAGLGDEDFASLSPEMAEKYMEHFKTPEVFAMVNGELTAIPVPPEPIAPDTFLTSERVETPRGSFSLTDMSREQMESTGYSFHHSSDDGMFHIMGNGTRAFAIINEDARTYDIYQLKDSSDRRDYAFESLDRLHEQGRTVDIQNYDMVYSDVMRPSENLESIYTRFNIDRPEDFTGHSLSMSDVVVIHQHGQDTAHYCDRFGFVEVTEFFTPTQEIEAKLSFYVAECMEFTSSGEYHSNLTLDEAIKHYEAIPAGRMNAIKGIGFTLREGSIYDGDFPLLSGNTIDVDILNHIEHYRSNPLVQQAVQDLIKKMPQAVIIRESENYLKNTEMAMEDDLGMLDGIINNGKKEVTPPGTDEKPSIRERLAEAKRECSEHKKPELKKPDKGELEHNL